jgi:hypothetical protein
LVLGDATVAPYNVVQPFVTASATPVVEGTVLTRNNGSWKGAAPINITQQWLRNGVPISGATSTTYTITDIDVGTAITCAVTGTNNYGNNTSQSLNGYTAQPSVPVGGIIIYGAADPNLPGWSRYSAADDLYIQGTDSQGSIGATTAASGILSAAYSLGTAGAHSSSNFMRIDSSANSGFNSNTSPMTSGDHTHTGSVADIDMATARPFTTATTLLLATVSQATFPANTIHIRATTSTGWTPKIATNAFRNIRGGASGLADLALVPASGSSTTSSSGAHNHINPGSFVGAASTQTGNTKAILNTTGQSHTHTLTATGYISNLLSKALKLWTAAAQDTPLSGDVIMFSGTLTNLPTYWKICDGTNGTVDMRDYFLGYSHEANTAHGATVAADLSASASTSTNTWTHQHGSGSTATNIFTTNMFHTSSSAAHSHAVGASVFSQTYVPPSIKLAFIQYVTA